jgi:hypothetical protein
MPLEMNELENFRQIGLKKKKEALLAIFGDKSVYNSTEIAQMLGYKHRSSIHFEQYLTDEELNDYRVELTGPGDNKPRWYYGKKKVVDQFKKKLEEIRKNRAARVR